MNKIKIKPLTNEQIIISLDRLTRFKNPQTKYVRVFCDIITHNLIYPKYKKSELETMDYTQLRDLAVKVINSSLEPTNVDLSINKRILEYEKSIFKFETDVEKLLQNDINYLACLKLINENSPFNLRWLKELVLGNDVIAARRDFGLRFPIEKVIIAEGATEEILLPKFAKLCGYDFDKEGIYLISAGGKNQVVKLYYELSQTLRLPIFVLLDRDGVQNLREIETKLRICDKVHILECGEFEDLLPFELIKRTLEYELENISLLYDIKDCSPRVKFLEEIFKTRGRHEFKKVDFAQSIAKNMSNSDEITPEIRTIIDEVKNIKNYKVIVDN